MPTISLEILIEDPHWRRVPNLNARLQKAAATTLASLPKSQRRSCAVTLLLTNDAAMRRLNRQFLGKDRPTNVLSFPQFTAHQLSKKGKKPGKFYAGDLAIGYQYVVDEAKRDHKILINHIIHLMVHGVLHLFGYDHVSGAGAMHMERLEKSIMAKLGLLDPYAPQPREPKAR
jgi:probable rRNA maturation factor